MASSNSPQASEDGVLLLQIPKRLAGQRLDEALSELVPDRTRSALQKLVRKGRVKLAGKRVHRSNGRVQTGQEIRIQLEPRVEPAPLTLEWIHVDDALAVVNKPAGMLVHDNEKNRGLTVADIAQAELGDLPTLAGKNRPGIVHRLDRETSGVMLIARTERSMRALQNAFREREVEKRYLALVHGAPTADEFRVDAPLAPVSPTSDLQRIDPAGKPAETEFKVLERFAEFTLIECRPKTGRRHQIRVHLASRNLPIVGDKLYRERGASKASSLLKYQALHAKQIAFMHPVEAKRVEFLTRMRDSMQALAEALGQRS